MVSILFCALGLDLVAPFFSLSAWAFGLGLHGDFLGVGVEGLGESRRRESYFVVFEDRAG